MAKIDIKTFYNDPYINSLIPCKRSIDHLNDFITERKLEKSDIVSISIEHTEAATGHPSEECLVLFYWCKE